MSLVSTISSKMKQLVASGCVLASFTCSAWAAPITWGTVTNIGTDLSSLNQVGTVEQAWDIGRTTGGVISVGGVDFAATPGGLITGENAGSPFSAANVSSHPDTDFNSVLDSFSWDFGAVGVNTMTVNLTGLVSGGFYRVQLFVVDERSAGSGRSQRFNDGLGNISGALAHQQVGPDGRYVIGSFRASGSTQIINVAVATGTAAVLNALVLRRVPEMNAGAAAIPVFMLSLVVLSLAERRRCARASRASAN